MVLDTDTYNEIDDQFALVHAVLSPDRVRLEAIYAAPFHNARSEGPGDGMRKSHAEIRDLLATLGEPDRPSFEGSTRWCAPELPPERSAAVEDLIERARSGGPDPLYVVAIGAATNVSSALLAAPEIRERVVVIWLGGHALSWPTASEFNLRQDPYAARVLFDSGVPLVHVPCLNVADHLVTVREEVERWVRPAGKVGAFLADRYAGYVGDRPGASKVIWDLAAVGWLLDGSWCTTVLTDSPILTEGLTWSRDPARHLIGEVTEVRRDEIFGDLFSRLAEHAGRGA